MKLWGKLPLEINGQRFNKAAIRAERQVFELKPPELRGYAPRIQLFPLLESNPGRVRLRFPENVFRAGGQLEFIDSDHNRLAPELTARFAGALEETRFRFPTRLVAGRVSILKPFDAGYLLVDDGGAVFHLKRLDGEPVVVKTHIPTDLGIRHIKIAENKRRELLGGLLDRKGRLHLIAAQDYRLIPLELPGYDPERMELKILFNPLHRTAVYSDRREIHAVAMDRDFQTLATYRRTMAMAAPRPTDRLLEGMAPFHIELHDPNSRYLALTPRLHGTTALLGIIAVLLLVPPERE